MKRRGDFHCAAFHATATCYENAAKHLPATHCPSGIGHARSGRFRLRSVILRSLVSVAVTVALFATGCGDRRAEAPATGTYGPLSNAPAQNVQRAHFDRSAEQPWTNGELAVIQSELSPATLYHSTSKTLSFFANMPETGIGGPAFACIETEQGPKIFKWGERIDPARMRESWFVVWWAGATNWTNWDSPWFLTLQHRPKSIRFDAKGLHFTFTNDAGYAALMPMYGYSKPLPAGQESSPFANLKEKKKRVLTWEWFKALPADPLARARYWASALREFPIYCADSFSVDRARDSVTIRQSFRWLSWNDDWKTEHLKLAPLSPVLAHAHREGFPAEFSKKPFDMEIFTSFGPFYGIEKVDSYEVTLPLLRRVNEIAGAGALALGWSNAPCFDVWRQAHVSGEWDSARQRWPALREAFRQRASFNWIAFAGLDVSPLEQAANALGAARLAYRLGDADTYAAACASFARSLTQLCAQQRGLNYFREQQPWRSMEPIGVHASLVTLRLNGWQLGQEKSRAVLEGIPDLARIWQDALPVAREPIDSRTVGEFERLIPGAPSTGFLFLAETLEATEAFAPRPNLVFEFEGAAHRSSTGNAMQTWPRLVWPDWKTPAGMPWNFGQVTASTNGPSKKETIPLNGNTRVIVYHAP